MGCQPAAILIHCCRAAVHLTCRYSGSAHDILAAVSNRIRRLEEAREQLRDDLGLHDIRKVRELITKYGSNWDKVVEKNEEMVQDLSAQLSQLSQREKELTKELMLEKHWRRHWRNNADFQHNAGRQLLRVHEVTSPWHE